MREASIASRRGQQVTLTEDLEDWADVERLTWTLWTQVADSPWTRVELAQGATAEGLSLVGSNLENILVCPTGPHHFVLRTAVAALPGVRVSTAWIKYSNRVRWKGFIKVPNVGAAATELVVTERTTGVSHEFPVRARVVSRSDAPRVVLRATFDVDWASLPTEVAGEWLDFSLVVTSGEYLVTRVGVPRPIFRRRVLHRVRAARADSGGKTRYYGPFHTFRARSLAAYVATISTETANEISRTSRFLGLRRAWYRMTSPPLWVVGETGFKAQDTGLHLFRYLRAHHPEIDARFVIEADSPDRGLVESVGPVLIHGEPEHARAVLLASRLVGSHHPEYLYPVRTNEFKRKVRATKVFQQHGVMGTKWMANLYGHGVAGFEADCFLVSSPSEKEMIQRDFGYAPKRVVVTGLSRFDALLAPSTPKPQLLIIPTWRDWVKDKESLLKSEFYERWLALVRSPQFQRTVADAGWHVKLILHPNFRHFADAFVSENVIVVHQGEETVQDLLRTSAVLLTDFSSVAFDFALLGRSVVYFHFDRERFLGKRGSHLDLDVDLPGDIAFDADGVIRALEAASLRGGGATEESLERARRFFPMMDRESSARVYEAIKNATPEPWHRLKSILKRGSQTFYKRFRRSRFYFPFARAFYLTVRLLPMSNNWVVFESGLGKQYGDSPKAIYRELSQRRPQMRKTWSYEGRISDADRATKTVPRLSLRYFYALARARYWVNNQSFPHYVRRRKRQVFVQTWHGTPLKRMARDLDEIYGRDDGYLQRALTGAQQWSLLISPNRFTSKVMRRAFCYQGEVLEVGYPRNDLLHGDRAVELQRKVRRALGLAGDKRIVLFAPTFRDRDLGQVGLSPVVEFGFDRWLEEAPADAVLLLRRHVLDKGTVPIPHHTGRRIIDVTSYPDIQDLLAAADVLVTDYSSVYFDYLNLQRPIVFFAPDLDDYRDVLRGFYLDYERDLPGPIAQTSQRARELVVEALEQGSLEGYDLEEFADRYCPLDDGDAAKRVVDHVFGTGSQA